jgi:hypothetical protein
MQLLDPTPMASAFILTAMPAPVGSEDYEVWAAESESEDSSELSMELVAVEVQASGSNFEGPNQTTPAVDTASAVLDIALDDAVAVEVGSRTGSVATEEEHVGV